MRGFTGDLPDRHPPGTPWRGEPYPGRRLLLVSEQGHGDTLWAARYVRRIKTLGGDLIVECRRELAPLLVRMLAGLEVEDDRHQAGAAGASRPDGGRWAL